MADVMADSSAWIEYFCRSEGAVGDTILRLLDEDRVVLCGMVELELLQGVRPAERRTLVELLQALSYVETERRDFVAAGERLAELRREGVTIPASDGLIATLCVRHRLRLLAVDAHFDHFKELNRLSVSSGSA